MKKHAITIAVAFVLAASFLLSCAHLVVRWPNPSEEKQDRTLELTRRENVFEDYLWATPPLYGRKLDLASGKATFDFNGRKYGPIKDGVFASDIEYGYFNLRVANPGHLDFRKTFSVGVDGTEVVIPYEPTPAAGGFLLTNHNFRNWKVVFDDGQAPVTYYNENSIAVPAGDYKVIVSDGTTNFGLDLKVKAGEVWEYNFADDKLEQKPAAAPAEENAAGDAADAGSEED
jgi:hypothetical protein